MPKKVRYEELFPHEMESIMRDKPIVYLPFGTLEWHGLHLALGNDAIKAYEICLRAAEKSGGVVAPPTYWAIGGMPHPWTTRFNDDLICELFYAIFEQMEHVGFKVAVAVTGHYGVEQVYALKKSACDFMYKSAMIVAPMPEYEVAYEKGYRGDHAAKWETSILWALRPELVDMGRLSKNLEEPLEGVMGEDPRVHASRELGEEVVNHIVERISEIADRLFNRISPLDKERYIRALSVQTTILSKVLGMREEGYPVLRSADYEAFITNLWSGKYVEAIKIGEFLLLKLREMQKSLHQA
ncbi:MAG: creatininase family protein [Candidatus Bathyarchaeia archaeon]